MLALIARVSALREYYLEKIDPLRHPKAYEALAILQYTSVEISPSPDQTGDGEISTEVYRRTQINEIFNHIYYSILNSH